MDFPQPVTVTIPYATDTGSASVLPYWYDSVTGAMSQQGITDIQNVYVSAKLSALRFRTTHFTPFYLIAADSPDTPPAAAGSGGGGGGCALAPAADGSPWQLLVPYSAIAVIMVVLRHRDKKNRLLAQSTAP